MIRTTVKTCLRCDWQGETRGAGCPNCGVPLYVIAAPPSARVRDPARTDHEERTGDASSPRPVPSSETGPASWSDPNLAEPDALGSPSRSARPGAAVAATVLALAIALGAWLASHEGDETRAPSVQAEEEGPTPDGPSPPPAPSPSPTPSGVGPIRPLPNPRSALWVGDARLSFRVPSGGWERFGDISVNKSIMGPQGAEAIVFWTSVPDGDIAEPCADLLSPHDGRSVADLATAVATAPGVELLMGPSDVTVGGRAAKHVVLGVRERTGCGPGFFFTWKDLNAGALWPGTPIGGTIRAWIVDVDGTVIFIGAATTRQADAELVHEAEQIVRSIRFDG